MIELRAIAWPDRHMNKGWTIQNPSSIYAVPRVGKLLREVLFRCTFPSTFRRLLWKMIRSYRANSYLFGWQVRGNLRSTYQMKEVKHQDLGMRNLYGINTMSLTPVRSGCCTTGGSFHRTSLSGSCLNCSFVRIVCLEHIRCPHYYLYFLARVTWPILKRSVWDIGRAISLLCMQLWMTDTREWNMKMELLHYPSLCFEISEVLGNKQLKVVRNINYRSIISVTKRDFCIALHNISRPE